MNGGATVTGRRPNSFEADCGMGLLESVSHVLFLGLVGCAKWVGML